MDDSRLIELKKNKKLFLGLFLGNICLNVVVIGTSFTLGSQNPFYTLLTIISLAVAVAFVVVTYKLARGLHFAVWSTVLIIVSYLFPITLFISIYILLREYKKQTGVEYTFLMFDKE